MANGQLYGEGAANAVEMECVDCHGHDARGVRRLRNVGTRRHRRVARISRSSGHRSARPVLPVGRRSAGAAVDGPRRTKAWRSCRCSTRSRRATRTTPSGARLAKTIRRDGKTWGNVPPSTSDVRAGGGRSAGVGLLRHRSRRARPGDTLRGHRGRPDGPAIPATTVVDDELLRLPPCRLARPTRRRPALHNEGDFTRNWTQYDYQVLARRRLHAGPRRIGEAQTVIAPVRLVERGDRRLAEPESRVALLAAADALERRGFSGQAFKPALPARRPARRRRRPATDCHPSPPPATTTAWMAQLLLQGDRASSNFLGRYVYVAEEGHGSRPVPVTEGR